MRRLGVYSAELCWEFVDVFVEICVRGDRWVCEGL